MCSDSTQASNQRPTTMKLTHATKVVALLASASAASGKLRNDKASKLLVPASRIVADALRSTGASADDNFPPAPGFAPGVKKSEGRAAIRNPERRIQEISDVCWDESNELAEGTNDNTDALLAAWDECEIDVLTGSTACPDKDRKVEIACTSDGGMPVYHNFAFVCTDGSDTFLVEYTQIPDCVGLSCEGEDLEWLANDFMDADIELIYGDYTCASVQDVCLADTSDTFQQTMDALKPVVAVCVAEEDPGVVTSTCPDEVDPAYQAACDDVGGQILLNDFAITCESDAGTFQAINYNYPLCVSSYCGPESADEVEFFAQNLLINAYESTPGVSCVEADLASVVESIGAPADTIEAVEEDEGGAEDDGSDMEEDTVEAETELPTEERDPVESETEVLAEEDGEDEMMDGSMDEEDESTTEEDLGETETEMPAEDGEDETRDGGDATDKDLGETETEMPAEDGEDEMKDVDPVPDETETDCYDESDAVNASEEMQTALGSALQNCKADFGEASVTVNCGSTPEYESLCEDFGGRVIGLDLEFMCSNPGMGFARKIPVSYYSYPYCTLCGPEDDDDFEYAVELIFMYDFLEPQGYVCNNTGEDEMGLDTSSGDAASVAYMVFFPMVIVVIGFALIQI